MASVILENVIEFQSETTMAESPVLGEKIGLFAALFGCWHDKISRPFMDGKTAYRACLSCGARKPFDPETLQTKGRFYYPPIVKSIEIR